MKKFVIFAGVNGAGKTTLFQVGGSYADIPRVNIDEMVREEGSWNDKNLVTVIGKRAVKTVDMFLSQGVSFNQETTLCGRSIMNNIHKAKESGYEIEMFYVGLESPELAIQRVEKRVRDGGHGIPETDVRRRYDESINNLKEVIPVCNRIWIYDNSDQFRMIATFIDGKCVDKAENIPDWCAFLADYSV